MKWCCGSGFYGCYSFEGIGIGLELELTCLVELWARE
jgi:hypothetical protein